MEKNRICDALKYSMRTLFISREEIRSTKLLISQFGKRVIESEQEADKLLAYMAKENPNSCVLSTDSDLLAHGCPNLIAYPDFKKDEVSVYNLQKILKELRMSYPQFVQFCVLLGTDYNPNEKGMGPQSAYKMASNLQTDDDFLSVQRKFGSDERNLIEIRDYFLNSDKPNSKIAYEGSLPEEMLLKFTKLTEKMTPELAAQIQKHINCCKEFEESKK
jgi:5'-3' exonuclease